MAFLDMFLPILLSCARRVATWLRVRSDAHVIDCLAAGGGKVSYFGRWDSLPWVYGLSV